MRSGFEDEQPRVQTATRAKQALKVLVIVSCFPPSKGGVEKTSYDLAMGLADEGNEVTVVTTSRGKEPGRYEERMGPLRVIRYPETRFVFDAPIVPRIAMAALTADYDVLHVHGMTPSITDLAIMFAKYRGKPVVLTYHNDAQETFPSPLARLAARVYSMLAIPIVGLADVIVTSTYSYAATSPVLKHLLGRVTVVPWGTDSSRFEQKEPFERDSAERHVLFVGQLKKYKGVEVLLDAVARLKTAGYPVVADIVGTGPQGESLKSYAARLNLDGSARFWGAIDEELLPLFYLGCDVVALPSLDRREAFGLVLLEAFAAGKPVVTTNIPGVSEAASRGVSYLAEPNDPDSLADCIKRALAGAKNGAVANKPDDLSQRKTLVKYESILRFASEGAKTWTFFLLTICTLAALQATGSLDSQNISAALTTLPN
jgi:glycosyltransferase involved in cell wall biosynthesis